MSLHHSVWALVRSQLFETLTRESARRGFFSPFPKQPAGFIDFEEQADFHVNKRESGRAAAHGPDAVTLAC